MTQAQTAIVVGAGGELGAALVRRFAAAGLQVVAATRRGVSLAAHEDRTRVHDIVCDATKAGQVDALFKQTADRFGPPRLVVFNVGTWDRAGITEISEALFERAWRTGCLAGFLVGRAAAKVMLSSGQGTILFTGATGSLRGGAGFAAFAVPKFGLRALAQSMARELGPKGIHVGHIIVDGMIEGHGEAYSGDALAPADMAESYWQIHCQRRGAWTHEFDLRPASEKF